MSTKISQELMHEFTLFCKVLGLGNLRQKRRMRIYPVVSNLNNVALEKYS
jgi:hypothetical protein